MNKKVIRDFLPPVLIRFLSGLFYGWHGKYSSWNTARNKCTGYDSNLIIDKVKAESIKVKDGKAVNERDSMVFDKKHYSYHL